MRRSWLVLAVLVLAMVMGPAQAGGIRGIVAGRYTNNYTSTDVESTIQVALGGQFYFAGQTWYGVVTGTMIRDNATDTYFPFQLTGMNLARSITIDCTWLDYGYRSAIAIWDAGFIFSLSCNGHISGSGSQVRHMFWSVNSKLDPDPLGTCSDSGDIPCTRGGVIIGTYRFA